MSVILDALRRSRRAATSAGRVTAPGALPHLPAGLGLGASSAQTSESRPTRPRLLRFGVLLVIGLGAWAVIQVSQSLMTNYAAPAQPGSATNQAPSQAPNLAPKQAPNPAPQSSSPTVVLRSAPAPDESVQSNRAANPFALAVRYQNLGDYDAALQQYRVVLAADRFNIEARNNLGLLYYRRGLTKEAIEQFQRAIAINPEYVKARSNFAVVLLDAGRLAEARAELRTAMAVEPRSADLIVNLALVEHADKHHDEAVELLVRAIGYQPTHALAHYNAGVLYEEQNALPLAYTHYTEFLKYGGPEHGDLLSAVQRRLQILKSRLSNAR